MARSAAKGHCDRVLRYVAACAPIASGLYSVRGYYSISGPLVEAAIAAGEGYVPYKMSGVDPDLEVVRAFQFKDRSGADWTTTDWSYTYILNNQFSTPTGDVWRPYRDSFVSKKSTSYSGEMRKVVQLLAGQNAPIAYDYGWPRTHGIFVNSQDASRWVIEISSDGVTAWPLKVCTGKSLVPDNALPYTPTTIKELPAIGNRRILGDSASVAAAYLGSALSSEIGWAFSGSGHEAQNVIVKIGYVVDTFDYMKTFRYKIVISSDTDGNPIGAFLSEEDSNWAYSPSITNQVRVPTFKDCGLASHRFDFFFGTEPEPPPIEGDIEFPVHVYYSGETAKIFTYTYVEVITEDPPDNWPSTCLSSSTFQLQDCNSFTLSPALQANGLEFYQNASDTKRGMLLNGVPGAETTRYNKLSRSSDWLGKQIEEETYDQQCFVISSGYKVQAIYGSYHVLKKWGWYQASQSKNYHFSFVIPFFEREGYFFQEKWEESATGSRYYESRYGGVGTSHDSGWAPLAQLVYNDGSLDPCIPFDSWSTRVDEDYDGAEDFYCYRQNPYSIESIVRFCEGPYFVDDCVAPGDTRIYYMPTGETAPRVNAGADCFDVRDPDPVETSSSYMKFFYGDSEGDKEVGVIDSADILFSGSVIWDPADCSTGSPVWMGAWLDAFQTGNGFISPEPAASINDPQIVGALGGYSVSPLEADGDLAGWLGCPFPESFSED